MYENEDKPTLLGKLKSFLRECVRVLHITKKPSKEEYWAISKVAGLGLLVIGLLGFLVHLVRVLVFK